MREGSGAAVLCRATLLVLVLGPGPALADPAARFTVLSVEHGLSQSTVQVILQDHVGFLWFGTDEGLNRYDGYTFSVFKHDPDDANSLPSDLVSALYEDGQHDLWVGTDRGLSLFDPSTQAFARIPNVPQRVTGMAEDPDGTIWIASEGGLYARDPARGTFSLQQSNPGRPNGLPSSGFSALLRDRRGRLWVGTHATGVELQEGRGQGFIHFRHDPREPRSIAEGDVWGLAEDARGQIWVAVYGGGVSVLDPDTRAFRHYRHDPKDAGSLGTDLVTDVYADHAGTVWVATAGGGVARYDPATDRFVAFRHDPADAGSLSQDVVGSIYEDGQGHLWVGTYLGGVNVMKHPRPGFDYYTHRPTDPSTLSDASVSSFLEDEQGRIWVGTEQGWLNGYDRGASTFAHYRFPSSLPNGSAILALVQDDRGSIWVGSYRGGLGRFDPTRGTFTLYRHEAGNPRTLGSDEVWALAAAESGRLWVGTDAGLDLFDPDQAIVIRHYETPTSLGLEAHGVALAGVRSLLVDRAGHLWVGSLGGLKLLLKGEGGFVHYRHVESDPKSLSEDGAVALHEDARARIWVGTLGGGLNLLDQVKGTFTVYKDFPSNVIHGIQEDREGRLWLSTNRGLSRFDPETGRSENFDLTNGLQTLQFHPAASLKTRRGRLLFGSIDGFYDFDPEAITPDRFAPPVVFTALRIFDQTQRPRRQARPDEITLAARDKVFSVEFAALDYTFPRRNQYAYRIEGLSDRWIQLGTQRNVTLANLDPGRYVFRVKASNSDGVWNEGSQAALRILARPPLGQTWWFRLACLGLLALGLWLAYQLYVRRLTAEIVDRQRAETALGQAEEKYRSIFENAVEGIFQSTPEGRFLTANPAFARMLGYSSAEEMVREVTDIERDFYVDPLRRREMRRLLEEHGVVRGFEFEVRRRDGRRIWVSENVRAVRDASGQVACYEGTVEDVTGRQRQWRTS